MKKDLHPQDYRPVVFQDASAKFAFLTKSTVATDKTIKWTDGNEYPLIDVHISSASHPFYTGEERIVDVEGRVDRFKARAEAAKAKKEALTNKAKKAAKKSTDKGTPEVQKLGTKPQKNNKKQEKNESKPVKEETLKREDATSEKPASEE